MPNVVIVRNTYPNEAALRNVIRYALDKAVAVGGYGVYANIETAYLQMKFVKEGPLREFCVSDFRQNQEYHVFNVHDGGLFPLFTSVPEGWGGMRAGTA